MASRYRKIDPRIWIDEKFRQLTAEEQRICLYILTAQSNRIGLFSFSPGKACEDLGTLPPTFRKGLEKVCQTLNWEWDSENRVLYLPTWWLYNQPENANNVIGNLKDLDDLPKTPLLERFSCNTTYLSQDLIETFTQTLKKRSPQRSPSQEQEQEQDTPPAVDREFDEFWKSYPMRDGRHIGKEDAREKWLDLSVQDRKQVLVAVQHYASSKRVADGIGIQDPHRWLRGGTKRKKKEPWREWLGPAQSTPSNGHRPSVICTKRVQGDKFLRDCGHPATPESSPTEPRCSKHFSESAHSKELTHAH